MTGPELCENPVNLGREGWERSFHGPSLGLVNMWLLGIVAALAGALGATMLSELRGQKSVPPLSADEGRGETSPIPESVARLLKVLPQTSVVVDSSGEVLRSTVEAQALGIVAGDRVVNRDIVEMVGEVARTGEVTERDVDLAHPSFGRVTRDMRVRVAPLSPSVTLILIEDQSESRRIDAVRRDFVANVSHELKTPVGALAILAEAVEAASDDPDQILHFARRMRIESARLAALINDIIDLSRLQGDNLLEHANVVDIDRVVAESIDATRLAADAKNIEVLRGGSDGLTVFGEEHHLVAVLRNLIGNAINYSPEHTRVAIGTRLGDGVVEISVTDQGIGIAPDEQSRIFERFYRVDQARSRDTGGTGLGLAIVKHVCANHGGEVSVWSRPGEGSTFTLRIPAHTQLSDESQVSVAATTESTRLEAAS